MISPEKLDELERLSKHFEARKYRAKERLAAIKDNAWHFAIVGLVGDASEFPVLPYAKLQRIIEPPGEVELASALKNKSLFSSVGRYSSMMTYELVISRNELNSDQAVFNLAWWIVSALRIKTLVEILVPAVSDYSWSTIAAVAEGECQVQLFEDVPKAMRFEKPIVISQLDVNWVSSNIVKFANLLETPKFRLASDSLTMSHFSHNTRMLAATIWAGIEALFEIQSELRFRLAVVIASILEPRGESRKAMYKTVKKLYDVRSKAVHGSPLSDDKIREHIIEARMLLSRLLCHFIETKTLVTEAYIEDMIFC